MRPRKSSKIRLGGPGRTAPRRQSRARETGVKAARGSSPDPLPAGAHRSPLQVRVHKSKVSYAGLKAECQRLRARHAELKAKFEVLDTRFELVMSESREFLRARRELEATLDHYAGLYDYAPAGFLRLDLQGTVLEANLCASAMLDCERDQFIGKNLMAFVSYDDRRRLREHLIHCSASGQAVRTELSEALQ